MSFRPSLRFPSAAATLAGLLSCLAPGCGDDPAPPPPSGAYDVESYELTGAYDWTRGRLAATVVITLTTQEPDIPALAVDSAVAEVKSVRAEGSGELPFTVDAEERLLAVDISGLSRPEGARLVLTIDYEAASGGELRAIPPRAGDPAGARALYTFSEPLGAASWMPCHNRPDDRALFSVEMGMDAAEEMVSNGDPVLDAPDGATGRRMGYATAYPLPTYLMAFAISDFEAVPADRGALPLSIWHRQGVAGDYPEYLAEIDRQIGLFESLLGPYPFEKYAVAMLPDFSGGMEHASVTFQTEIAAGQPDLDRGLTAHELGHQWFGDLVTVATWDDVWIKEGMATLLGAEAGRAAEDQSGAGTLLGDRFYVAAGEAIRDTSLAPDDKYTSGPYDRAAWLFSQIRSVIGEEAFWGALRGMLEDEEHRFGVVGTEDVLAAFAPALGPDASAAARRAVDARGLPSLEVAAGPSGGAVLTLRDPDGILVAPVEIEWHREGGASERQALVPGEPLEVKKSAEGDFLVLDPRDVHPDLRRFIADDVSSEAYGAALEPLLLPGTPAAVAPFTEIAGAHQLAALAGVGLPPVAPDAFAAFSDALDAESAKAVSIAAACDAAAAEEDQAVRDAWVPVLTAALTGEPRTQGLPYVASYEACNDLVAPLALFAAEWAELEAGLAAPGVSHARLFYLSRFTLPLPDALDAWGNVARSGYSLRARALAARMLRRHAGLTAEATPEEITAFRALVVELLGASEASEVLRQIIPAATVLGGATASENADALAALQAIVQKPVTRAVHASAICAAYSLSAGDQAAWEGFVAGLAGAELSAGARGYLDDPSRCG